MQDYEKLTLIIAIFAALVSIISVIYTVKSSKKISSGDYRAAEQVKTDTARLLASFKSILNKSLISLDSRQDIDINHEKSIITDFLNSTSCFAYYAWLANSKADKRKTDKLWNIFFLNLVKVLASESTREASNYVIQLEKTFSNIKEKDLHKIANYNSNLSEGISKNLLYTSNNIALDVITRSFSSSNYLSKQTGGDKSTEKNIPKNKDNNNNYVKDRLNYLKNIGVEDSNINLFLGLYNNDSKLSESALEAGANPYITDKDILKMYSKELEKFGKVVS